MNLKTFFKNCKKSINTQFLYQQNAHFILYVSEAQNFNITFCKNLLDYKGQ